MKKYTIITTYPNQGSKNIGDALITKATIDMIKDVKKSEDIKFEIVWREDEWTKIQSKILESDVIIFAGLAIRQNMTEIEYPTINNIINTGKQFCVIASGTNINTMQTNVFDALSKETIEILKKLNEKSLFFGTRGYLSQSLCDYYGLTHTHFTGDVAFFDKRFKDLEFKEIKRIKRIAISDPHMPSIFIKSFSKLINEVKTFFRGSDIEILIHGRNIVIENFCKKNNIRYKKIYEDKYNGLDYYSDFDIHIGYRVHGHVSMLKRRKPSYLLEQDGRGIDYGLTFDIKNSVNSIPNVFDLTPKNILRKILGKNPKYLVNESSVDKIMAIIKQDYKNSFIKFKGFEKQISKYVNNIYNDLKKLP